MNKQSDKTNKSGPDMIYRSFLDRQIFALPKCLTCNKFHFFPRVICPHCGEFELEWLAVSGKGEVYSTSTIHRKPERGGDYNVCLITLDEGPRMMSRIEGIDAKAVNIGDKVTARIINDDDEPFVVFTPSKEAS